MVSLSLGGVITFSLLVLGFEGLVRMRKAKIL